MKSKNMNTNFTLTLAIIVLTSTSFAQGTIKEPCDQKGEITDLNKKARELKKEIEHNSIQDCSSTKQKVSAGTSCKTSKGFKFTRIANGWKDEKGKTWYDDTKAGINQYEARRFCSDQKKILPTGDDFKLAEAHGIREVFFKGKRADLWFWSAADMRGAYRFEGTLGHIWHDDVLNEGSALKVDAACCVNP